MKGKYNESNEMQWLNKHFALENYCGEFDNDESSPQNPQSPQSFQSKIN